MMIWQMECVPKFPNNQKERKVIVKQCDTAHSNDYDQEQK